MNDSAPLFYSITQNSIIQASLRRASVQFRVLKIYHVEDFYFNGEDLEGVSHTGSSRFLWGKFPSLEAAQDKLMEINSIQDIYSPIIRDLKSQIEKIEDTQTKRIKELFANVEDVE
jgi:hypothetical protein